MKDRKNLSVTETVLSFSYKGTPIKYSVWHTPLHASPTVVLFLGAGQVGKLATWVAEHCPAGTLVVQGLPHWLVDEYDISDFTNAFFESVFDGIISRYRIGRLHILAESQAVPSVIHLFTLPRYSRYLRTLILIQPLGLNRPAFVNDTQDPLAAFNRRAASNLRYQLPMAFEKKLWHNHKTLLTSVNLRDPKIQSHYLRGLTHDAAPDLKRITALKKPIFIISGANDKFFPPNEIEAILEQNYINLPVHRIPRIPHSPLATSQGVKLLRKAFQLIGL